MSCLNVNAQFNKQVVKIHNQNDVEVKREVPIVAPVEVHYPDLKADESVSNLILQFILNDLEDHSGYILLDIDQMKRVLKVLCHCDDVIVEVEPGEAVPYCCTFDTDRMNELVVKKILLKYNNKDCLENFKMHYNEIKTLTESYKVDIKHVKSM